MAIFDSDEPNADEFEGKDEIDEPDKYVRQTGQIFVAILLLELPLIIFPFFVGKTEFLIGISLCAMVNILAVLKCGELWNRIWFWIVVVFIQGASAALAVFAHWPKVMMTRLTLLPIGVAYYCLTVGVVTFFDRFVFHSNSLSEE